MRERIRCSLSYFDAAHKYICTRTVPSRLYSWVCCGWAWVSLALSISALMRPGRSSTMVTTSSNRHQENAGRTAPVVRDVRRSFLLLLPSSHHLPRTLSRSDTKLPALLRCPLPTSYSISYNLSPRLIFSFWTSRILRFCRIAPKRRFFLPLKAFLRYQWHCVFLLDLITGHRSARSNITNRIGFFKSYNSVSLIITLLFTMSNGKPFISFLQYKKNCLDEQNSISDDNLRSN